MYRCIVYTVHFNIDTFQQDPVLQKKKRSNKQFIEVYFMCETYEKKMNVNIFDLSTSQYKNDNFFF